MDHVDVSEGRAPAASAFTAAYAEYAQALLHLGSPPELERRAADAYSELAAALERAAPSEELERAVHDAHARYAAVLAEALDDAVTRARFDAAYRDYVACVRRSLIDLDLDTLDAGTIGELGQQLTAVAWMVRTGEHEDRDPLEGH